jgi:hypothetical protein
MDTLFQSVPRVSALTAQFFSLRAPTFFGAIGNEFALKEGLEKIGHGHLEMTFWGWLSQPLE